MYQDLTRDELLERCLGGRTQNPNESLHCKIWYGLSETKFYGLKNVQYSAAHTILQHNMVTKVAVSSQNLVLGNQQAVLFTFCRGKTKAERRKLQFKQDLD